MSKVPDFTDSERAVVAQTMSERFGKAVELLVADAVIRLYSDDRERTEVPVFYGAKRNGQFVILKTGEHHYRNRFFYSVRHPFGTGREAYDDILDCVVSLLRVQADHEAQQSSH